MEDGRSSRRGPVEGNAQLDEETSGAPPSAPAAPSLFCHRPHELLPGRDGSRGCLRHAIGIFRIGGREPVPLCLWHVRFFERLGYDVDT